MGTRWSRERYAQYRARHPAVESSERNREAQARYRVRHAKRLAAVRRVANILARQSEHPRDVDALAAALRATLTAAGLAALQRALRRRRTQLAR